MSGRVMSEDDLDEYEYSDDDPKYKKNGPGSSRKVPNTYDNKPYDEAYEISQDLSVAESFDAKEKNVARMNADRDQQMKGSTYNDAMDGSSSVEHDYTTYSSNKSRGRDEYEEKSAKATGHLSKQSSKTHSISNRPFDEAYEMSQSTSEDSIDTQGERDRKQESLSNKMNAPTENKGNAAPNMNAMNTKAYAPSVNHQGPIQSLPQSKSPDMRMKVEESSDGEHEESYDNIEGAYNPNDYSRLGVSSDIKDLFQYIERYKPHEAELETSLKCFIPEYIPTVGDIDSFVKIPRPDNKEDDLGFKVLDEPSSNQSDPSVLELQLKSMSKKLQYGDVAVRSIENASKNPAAIEKWIQNVSELHRTKPPPHVTYKKNMPEIEKLMEAWPEDFEETLKQCPLPSPELDLSLMEYVKVVCSILDIPVYDNPIESLHLLFSLFSDFRNNPHFQARHAAEDFRADAKSGFGNADVLEIDPGFK